MLMVKEHFQIFVFFLVFFFALKVENTVQQSDEEIYEGNIQVVKLNEKYPNLTKTLLFDNVPLQFFAEENSESETVATMNINANEIEVTGLDTLWEDFKQCSSHVIVETSDENVFEIFTLFSCDENTCKQKIFVDFTEESFKDRTHLKKLGDLDGQQAGIYVFCQNFKKTTLPTNVTTYLEFSNAIQFKVRSDLSTQSNSAWNDRSKNIPRFKVSKKK
ncbi:hypothetical protein HMI54_012299 [Coelomomyces lativittatus]|nr:hypothetical protein HMI56_006639 [Coelomomyces lativittatus]KAJ1515455.1 hypothetical protein HMI54_012299 [Coelomomyces lativittatus]KAJ1517322.1 hypothetical protein HMI55_000064 [Coelomomyces lativittatus]